MGWRTRVGVFAVGGLSALMLVGCGSPKPWQSELVSVNAAANDSGNRYSAGPSFSPDGTKIAFESGASNLGPTDTNNTGDIYVRDLVTGTTTLVSARADGLDGGNGLSLEPDWSPDGTKIVFSSRANDLGPIDTNGHADIYVRDLVTGTTTLVSTDSTGTTNANGTSYGPSYSPDGAAIAFHSRATNLGPTDTNGLIDIYLRNLTTATTTLVSANASRTNASNGESTGPAFNATGRLIAFNSTGSDFGTTDTNRCREVERPDCSDVYLFDQSTGTTTLISHNAAGNDSGNAGSGIWQTGPETDVFAFTSYASDLVPGDANGTTDVFVYDPATGVTTLASTAVGSSQTANGISTYPVLSADGDQVAFHSAASNLVANDTNDTSDVFVHDLVTGTTTLVSVNGAGDDSGNARSGSIETPVSFRGDKVAFKSWADDLGSPDTNGQGDIYVRDLAAGTTALLSANAAGTDSSTGGEAGTVALAPDGMTAAFTSPGSDLGPTDTNGETDVYLARPRPTNDS